MMDFLAQKCYTRGNRYNAKPRAINTRPLGHTGLKEAVQPYDLFYTIPESYAISKPANFGGAIMATSKMQRAFATALFNHFPGYTIKENTRPYWCIGDEGERLELDFWLVELDVAIEIQGRQHVEFVPHFHGTYTNFKKQLRRDELKHYHCQAYGITLLEVFDDETFETAIQTIYGVSGGVYAVKEPDHEIRTPEQWKQSLTDLNSRVIWLFQQRNTMPKQYFATEIMKLKNKLMAVTQTHGMKIFRYVDPEIAQSLFLNIHRCQSHFGKIKSNEAAYRRGLARKQADEGGAE